MSENTNIWEDFGIDQTDWLDDPKAFSNRILAKADELRRELQSKNSVANLEENFKAKALSNKDAAAIAEEFIENILNTMAEFDPEVVANILVRFPEVTKTAHTIIRSTSMRKNRVYSKKRLHAMYVKLRKMYGMYTDFMKMYAPDKKFPMIPAMSGNYADDKTTLGITEYAFVIDDEEYYNWYHVARMLDVKIENYMDLVEIFENAKNNKINGKKVSLVDLSR